MTDRSAVAGGAGPDGAPWLAQQGDMSVVRLAAELGDDDARQHLRRWQARLAERAAARSGQPDI